MNFENGTVDSIRSTSQRGLAAYWARLALTRQGLPPFDQFAPGPGVHDPKHLAVWKVEANLVYPAEGRKTGSRFEGGL